MAFNLRFLGKARQAQYVIVTGIRHHLDSGLPAALAVCYNVDYVNLMQRLNAALPKWDWQTTCRQLFSSEMASHAGAVTGPRLVTAAP